MSQESNEVHGIARNTDGTFAKGHSGNPGARLSAGQKIVRQKAIEMLPNIMNKLGEMFDSYETPIDIRVKIACIMIDRGAGKVEEAPTRDDSEDGDVHKMTGADLTRALAWLMDKERQERNGN
jgi:hypothetical protein